MRWLFTAASTVLLPILVFGQETATLTYHGEPLPAPFSCSEDELRTAGLLCSEEEPCSIYLELNGIAPAGRKLFVAGDLHTNSATLYSILLASADGGTTWREAAPRIRGAALDQVQFYDLEHGWAAGETQYPLPRDPFLLLTTDGGASWRSRPVAEEGSPGSVQHFWFDSAQHGELIIDAGRHANGGRYADYESQTGGENWSLHSTTDQAPKIKRATPASDSSDFRIRPAANGKAYLIEKRLGEKWETAASFLIEAATCRIAPPAPPAPPPDAAQPARPSAPKD